MAISEKWAPVFENEELLEKVLPMKPEDAQKVLTENGYDFTLDEILEVGKELYMLTEQMTGENDNSDELEEDDLENIAGGILSQWWRHSFPGPFPRRRTRIQSMW